MVIQDTFLLYLRIWVGMAIYTRDWFTHVSQKARGQRPLKALTIMQRTTTGFACHSIVPSGHSESHVKELHKVVTFPDWWTPPVFPKYKFDVPILSLHPLCWWRMLWVLRKHDNFMQICMMLRALLCMQQHKAGALRRSAVGMPGGATNADQFFDDPWSCHPFLYLSSLVTNRPNLWGVLDAIGSPLYLCI